MYAIRSYYACSPITFRRPGEVIVCVGFAEKRFVNASVTFSKIEFREAGESIFEKWFVDFEVEL